MKTHGLVFPMWNPVLPNRIMSRCGMNDHRLQVAARAIYRHAFDNRIEYTAGELEL